MVVAPRPLRRARPAELPRGWAQQGLVLVAGGARAGVAGAGGHERGAVRSAAPSPALAASEHNTAVVGVMMEVSPVSELPRVLTQENDLWLQKIKTNKQQTQSLC